MKYMGSKRYMLENGLGKLLLAKAKGFKRFVDLFSGSGSVSSFVAENTYIEVVATDLQAYSSVLSGAIIGRTEPVSAESIVQDWHARVLDLRKGHNTIKRWKQLSRGVDPKEVPDLSREFCRNSSLSLTAAYGGYYFGVTQSVTLDLMLKTLPREEPVRTICLASIIDAASKCAASPGHTAQPLRPNSRSLKYIEMFWSWDPIEISRNYVQSISTRHAKCLGTTLKADAQEVAMGLRQNDLVFVDPPYTDVQYSRFYHVFESIANEGCGEVFGAGRYPPLSERPQSSFSRRSESKQAFEKLIRTLSCVGATTVVTFPANERSNGMSGDFVKEICRKYYSVTENENIKHEFSTLGGNNIHRKARHPSNELILLLEPK